MLIKRELATCKVSIFYQVSVIPATFKHEFSKKFRNLRNLQNLPKGEKNVKVQITLQFLILRFEIPEEKLIDAICKIESLNVKVENRKILT